MNFWISDPKTSKPSVTLSAFVYGFAVATVKLLLAGVSIGTFIKSAEFSGVDYAAVVGALGAVYTIRKNKSIKADHDKN